MKFIILFSRLFHTVVRTFHDNLRIGAFPVAGCCCCCCWWWRWRLFCCE